MRSVFYARSSGRQGCIWGGQLVGKDPNNKFYWGQGVSGASSVNEYVQAHESGYSFDLEGTLTVFENQ